MSITRTPIVDDDGSRTTGTVLNNAWKQELYDQIDAFNPSGVSAPSTTGNITSLPLPAGAGPLTIRMNNASLATIQGIAAGLVGQELTIMSIGAGQVDFSWNDAAATGARVITIATSGKTSLSASFGIARFVYDGSGRWMMQNHEQGAWIAPAYAGGNFTANAGTWTVDAGDVVNYEYLLRGRSLTVIWYLQTTSTSAGMNTDLRIAIPGGYVSARDVLVPSQNADNNSNAIGNAIVALGGTVIILRLVNVAVWTSNVTNLTAVRGEVTFEVN